MNGILRWIFTQLWPPDPETHVSQLRLLQELRRHGEDEQRDAYSQRYIRALRQRIADGVAPSRPLVRSRAALAPFRAALKVKREGGGAA